MTAPNVPAVLDGHWSSSEGHEIAVEYAGKERAELCMGHLPDLALANAVYMVDRNSLQLLGYQTAAKERIRWLSVKLAEANAALEKARGQAA